jgi:integrase/recombinase XerD
MLSCIRNYYQYLKEMNPKIPNPALNLNLRGVQRKVPVGMISYHTLEDLYGGWPKKTAKDKRNRVTLGLLIYQGITTGELGRLEVEHVNLEKKKIRIPGTPRSNGRMLPLHENQVKDLELYMAGTRPKILREVGKSRLARRPDKINQERIQEQMVISINGSEHIKSSLHFLFKQVQEQLPELLHPKQIRTSVITHWLKDHNLRQVQYMAGHKHVSSTERYQMGNLAGLQSKLEKYHPLNQTI